MAVLKCKICGGSLNFERGDFAATCEYCGSKQTLPLSDDQIAQFNRINELRMSNDYEKALELCEQTILASEKDAEAYWNLVLCKFGIEYVKDPRTRKQVPTINRMQYDSILKDKDYLKALAFANAEQRAIYEEQANEIFDIQKRTLKIIKNEKPFDVFICYKETDENGERTRDSVIAEDLYHTLTRDGFKVFFSKITLEEKLGTEYEPYIFAALHSAKVMVVLGTKPEHFNAVWVKNEWSRFLTLAKENSNKLLVPAYMGMDAYDLPAAFSHLQAQDMSKLGFMQDLTRGIKKILNKSKKKVLAPILFVAGLLSVALIASLAMVLSQGEKGAQLSGLQSTTLGTVETDPSTEVTAPSTEVTDPSTEATDPSTEATDPSTAPTTPTDNEDNVKDFSYEILSNGVKITKYNGVATDVEIPSKVNGASVIAIGDEMFKNNSSIESVIIPNTVNSIGYRAFFGCTSLKSVNIPDSVTSIGASAFATCSGLISITIPDSVTSIGDSPFGGCSSLTNVIIGDGVTRIGEDAFYDCDGLTSVTIGNGVTSIGAGAFVFCSSLTSITIPDSVTSIGASAFGGCSSLSSITIPDSVTSIGASAFGGCSSLTNVIIGDGVANIGEEAFYNCDGLTNVTIGNGGAKIGKRAFEDCSSLSSVTLGNGVTNIGERAFSYCNSLTSIVIPDSVTSIGTSAFDNCRSLTSVTLGNGVTSIGEKAFYNCDGLTSIVIPDSVTSIGTSAFYGCDGLTSIVIPNSVTSIGDDAFASCSSLKTVYFSSEAQKEKLGSIFYKCELIVQEA